MKNDRRYETFEMRAAYDPRYRLPRERAGEHPPVCRCGKTVLTAGVTCPRRCEER